MDYNTIAQSGMPQVYQQMPIICGHQLAPAVAPQNNLSLQPTQPPVLGEHRQGNVLFNTSISSIYPQTTSQIQQLYTETPISDRADKWHIVENNKKRPRNSPEYKAPKQTKIDDYWLNSHIKMTNRFSCLDNNETDGNDDKEDKDNNQTNPNSNVPNKQVKPPPIFVNGVQNIKPLQELLNSLIKNNYEMKILSYDQVKIQPQNPEDYTKITKALQDKNTQFHTFQLKSQRNFRVVLKNLHYSTDLDMLKEEIKDQGHEIVNIWNIKNYKTKAPLSMFYVDLKPGQNNKDIYNIDSLLSCKIKFEPPRPKREIPQCGKCQRYGHTKKYCHQTPRCVKCTGNHGTDECSRKERSADVKCVLCNGNHPANYKGCTVYKDLLKKKFPPLRTRQQQPVTRVNIANTVQPNISYAQMAHNNLQEPSGMQIPQNQIFQNSQTDMGELKNMLKNLMEQMSTMLNLLTTVVAKISK